MISCETKLGNNLIDILGELSDFDENFSTLANPSKFCSLIYQLSCIIPSIVTCVMPKLQDLLFSEAKDDRMCLSQLFAKLLSSREAKISVQILLGPFLKRFVDIESSIRSEVVRLSKGVLDLHPEYTSDIVDQVVGRLLDSDDKVRQAACIAFCEISKIHPAAIAESMLEIACSRMLDKSSTVRNTCMNSIGELFVFFKDADLVEKSTVILTSCLKLFPNSEVQNEAEHALDSILLPTCEREHAVFEVYSNASKLHRKYFSNHLIQHKFRLAKRLKELSVQKENIDLNLWRKHAIAFMEKILGIRLSPDDQSNLVHFIFSDEDTKVLSWFFILCDFGNSLQDKKTAQQEICKACSGESWHDLVQVLTQRLGIFIVSPRDAHVFLSLSYQNFKKNCPKAETGLELIYDIFKENPDCSVILSSTFENLFRDLIQNVEINVRLIALVLKILEVSLLSSCNLRYFYLFIFNDFTHFQ